MRFAFIAKHCNIWQVSRLCDVLEVSRSGFNAWLNRPTSIREIQDAKRAGALLDLGDCHASQGNGEPCGVAVEMPATGQLQVDLVKGHIIGWPRLETETTIMTFGTARPLQDAAGSADLQLVRWNDQDTDMGQEEADMVLTMAGTARLGNMVAPKHTIGTGIAREYLGL